MHPPPHFAPSPRTLLPPPRTLLRLVPLPQSFKLPEAGLSQERTNSPLLACMWMEVFVNIFDKQCGSLLNVNRYVWKTFVHNYFLETKIRNCPFAFNFVENETFSAKSVERFERLHRICSFLCTFFSHYLRWCDSLLIVGSVYSKN